MLWLARLLLVEKTSLIVEETSNDIYKNNAMASLKWPMDGAIATDILHRQCSDGRRTTLEDMGVCRLVLYQDLQIASQ